MKTESLCIRFVFVDSEGVKLAQTLKNGLKYGVIRKFDTLEELAKAYGIPTDNLIKQVNEFNEYVRNGKDMSSSIVR